MHSEALLPPLGFTGSFEVEKMSQEVPRRFQMLVVLWSILLVSVVTGLPTRRKNIAHKVSSLLHFFLFLFPFCVLAFFVA